MKDFGNYNNSDLSKSYSVYNSTKKKQPPWKSSERVTDDDIVKNERDAAVNYVMKMREKESQTTSSVRSSSSMISQRQADALFEKANASRIKPDDDKKQINGESVKPKEMKPEKTPDVTDEELKKSIEKANEINEKPETKSLGTNATTEEILNAALNEIF